MNEQQKGAVPYKVEPEQPERKYEIQKNGDVLMHEVQRSKSWFNGREFISFIRLHEKDKENFEYQLTEAARKKTKEVLKKLDEALKVLKPLQKEVETKLKAEYEHKKFITVKETIKQVLQQNPEEVNKEQLAGMWGSLNDEQKQQVITELDKSQKNRILQLKIEKKKQQRESQKMAV